MKIKVTRADGSVWELGDVSVTELQALWAPQPVAAAQPKPPRCEHSYPSSDLDIGPLRCVKCGQDKPALFPEIVRWRTADGEVHAPQLIFVRAADEKLMTPATKQLTCCGVDITMCTPCSDETYLTCGACILNHSKGLPVPAWRAGTEGIKT